LYDFGVKIDNLLNYFGYFIILPNNLSNEDLVTQVESYVQWSI